MIRETKDDAAEQKVEIIKLCRDEDARKKG